jgi:hypothetical protein
MTGRLQGTVSCLDGGTHLEVTAPGYTARVERRRLLAEVRDRDGAGWGPFRLLASVHTLDGPDETVRVTAVEHERHGDGVRVTVRCTSSRWAHRTQTVHFGPDGIAVWATVRGRGRVTTVRLLGGERVGQGLLPSGSGHATVFSPNPDHPWRIARAAGEPAVVGVTGEGGEPGVGHWLFTPAPACFALSREPAGDGRRLPPGPWLMLGLAARHRTFVEFGYDPTPGGFSLRCEYQGHTAVDGEFRTPAVLVLPGATDPYDGLARYRERLVASGLAPRPDQRPPLPAHWYQPMFCGWGAQCARAARDGGSPADQSRQDRYEEYLDALAARDLVPGTVVVDDKWQDRYATCRPDTRKWPDLAGFIRARHDRGQRVLLWWKAWDPEGAPPEACVRDPDGLPVAIDPQSRAGRAVVEDAVCHMLDPAGLGADGLKVDFSARTPSGAALAHAGPAWGFELLHELLAVVYRTAKRVRPDCLIVTHTPEPGFLDVCDMIRLNDVLHLDHPDGLRMPGGDPAAAVVEQMSYRAGVVRAACPEMPVDTDGWCLPGEAALAGYAAAAPALGVPALYYADRMDLDGRPVADRTWAAVARAWADYRRVRGLRPPGHTLTVRDA